jgi:hypothetical protein
MVMSMASHLKPVADALANPIEPGIDGFEPANDADSRWGGGGGWGRPPKEMPEGCPVVPVGTEDGVFYFLTALGELRGLTCDKVANKHIVGMFAPDSDYLMDQWPRKKLVKTKDAEGNEVEDWIVTGWRNDDVAMLLMDVAAGKGVWNARERVRGRGAWKGDDGGLILHTGNHVMIGGTWNRPGMYDDMVYPTAPAIPKPAAEPDRTGEEIAPKLVHSLRARGVKIAENASPARVLLELFKTWNWARPMIDPMLLLGWNAAAIYGGALDYRPLSWITGDKATGKSALQKLIGWLHDGGILQSPDASEAAVRQVLGQQSLPVGIDEAEAEADNRKILALVKLARLAATSQGNIMRGGQDHKGHEFQATSCFLFSSILVPPIPPQDRSRLAVLELGELPAGAREPAMDKREINALGAAMRRRLADRWPEWPAVLEAYKDALIDFGKHGGRVSDQFGTLLAAAHVLLEDDAPEDDALAQWGQLLAVDQLAETSDESDEATRCIHHLASSLVQLAGHGTPRQVAEWILQATEPLGVGLLQPGTVEYGEAVDRRKRASDMLAKISMRIVTGKTKAKEPGDGQRARPVPGREYLAVAASGQGLAKLFENTHWKEGVWTQALKRIKGAVPNDTQRIAGMPNKCTLVPIDAFLMRDDDAATVEREEEEA